ncbi:hypothetical protein G5I_11737 [Acromyrmex echinatior]|uniref:Uncharacterized protein n=1 Tax=Acromyrmex echinatior TaxID=103372 RepID=F4X0E5_ACREC|nr:hypothetical protein G5I_11737 [Acromyrmex echinatior]
MRAGKKVKQRERHRKDEAGERKREKVADHVELENRMIFDDTKFDLLKLNHVENVIKPKVLLVYVSNCSIDGVMALSIFRHRVGMSAYQRSLAWNKSHCSEEVVQWLTWSKCRSMNSRNAKDKISPLFFSFFSYRYHGLPRLKHIFSKAASFLRSIVVLLRVDTGRSVVRETRSIFSGIKILRTPGGCLKVEETTCRTDGSISSNSSSAQQAAGAISRTISPQFVTECSGFAEKAHTR